MAEDIKPTRSELIKLKRKIKLAKNGYELLKKKKDGLIQEFFSILDEVRKNRDVLGGIHRKSITSLELSRAMDGTLAVESTAFSVTKNPEIKVHTKNIMGVSVPEIEIIQGEVLDERNYGIIGSSSYVDTVVDDYQELLEKIVLSAEMETAMKRLLLEIEKTRRRVSALEYIVIPRMEGQAKFIRARLEELERENLFKLKLIKKK